LVLNIDEAEDYFDSDEDRIAYPTPYVAAQGIHISEIGSAWWCSARPERAAALLPECAPTARSNTTASK